MALSDDRLQDSRAIFEAAKREYGKRRLKRLFVISKTHGYLYVSNAKAACSTIRNYLARCELGDPSFFPKSAHNRDLAPHLQPFELSPATRDRLFGPDFFVFSFVRHPIRRAISAYRDKILQNRPQKTQILRQLGYEPDADVAQPVSFNQYVDAICALPLSKLDFHWAPQTKTLAVNVVPYDFIGRIERFDTDLAYVRQRLDLPDFPVPRRNDKLRDPAPPPEKLVTPENEQKLTRLYADDFEKFGYRPGDWRHHR